MIDSRELMIGNKFINPKYPDILDEVQQLHSEYAVSDYSDSIAYTDMTPIPLSPKVLEAAGSKWLATLAIKNTTFIRRIRNGT